MRYTYRQAIGVSRLALCCSRQICDFSCWIKTRVKLLSEWLAGGLETLSTLYMTSTSISLQISQYLLQSDTTSFTVLTVVSSITTHNFAHDFDRQDETTHIGRTCQVSARRQPKHSQRGRSLLIPGECQSAPCCSLQMISRNDP